MEKKSMNDLDDNYKYLLEIINSLIIKKQNGNERPHKLVFLLAVIKLLFDTEPYRINKIYLNDELENTFIEIWFDIFHEKPNINAIEYPFFHLQSDGFWKLKIKEGYEYLYNHYKDSDNCRLTKNRLIETIDYGQLNDNLYFLLKDRKIRKVFNKILLDKCTYIKNNIHTIPNKLPNSIDQKKSLEHNPFVTYLNSLHSRDAGNENALAEGQACNVFFPQIFIQHPLTKTIINHLCQDHNYSAILTGHAGDGKSTIALSVYKYFKNIDEEIPLNKPLQKREDIKLSDNKEIAIIKDLSEWDAVDRIRLIKEIAENKTQFLLVSNTGTLLNCICEYSERYGHGNRAEWEPKILEAMDTGAKQIKLGFTNIEIFNLAIQDNLKLARKIFTKILDSHNWEICANQPCHKECPIWKNVTLIKENDYLALERIFLAYRRMFEYGTRLTIRQLTAHFAYMITSGIECKDIFDLLKKPFEFPESEYLFYNRFFGDNGINWDRDTINMKVFQEIRSQEFGEKPCPKIEQHLWLMVQEPVIKLCVPLLEEEFIKLLNIGKQSQQPNTKITPPQARNQVRRMLYFLRKFENSDDEEAFIRQYLNSLAIIKWSQWQNPEYHLSIEEKSIYQQRMFHVLQEQFTGVRFPEIKRGNQSYLYITLSRRNQEIRQSAQVVLAQIDFNNALQIKLLDCNKNGFRRDLVLVGQGPLDGIQLILNLPFLDYVLARHQGDVGKILQASYMNRLEHLKAQLVQKCSKDIDDDMLLIRLRTNNQFIRQQFAVSKGKLEVSDA